jgi:hypothetical protein
MPAFTSIGFALVTPFIDIYRDTQLQAQLLTPLVHFVTRKRSKSLPNCAVNVRMSKAISRSSYGLTPCSDANCYETRETIGRMRKSDS